MFLFLRPHLSARCQRWRRAQRGPTVNRRSLSAGFFVRTSSMRCREISPAADAGAHAVLLPAEWVPGPLKEYHWSTLIRARAIENTVYLVASGQNAPTGSGHSMIVDPMGVVVTSLGEQTGTAAGEISRHRIDEVRTKNPALKLRRFTVGPR